eukprot:scaffold62706_cov48-Cyclotella_meneghiniana.AAC.3
MQQVAVVHKEDGCYSIHQSGPRSTRPHSKAPTFIGAYHQTADNLPSGWCPPTSLTKTVEVTE